MPHLHRVMAGQPVLRAQFCDAWNFIAASRLREGAAGVKLATRGPFEKTGHFAFQFD